MAPSRPQLGPRASIDVDERIDSSVLLDHGVQVIGISSEQLFAADFGPSERGTATFDRLLRYDLAKLEAFSVQL